MNNNEHSLAIIGVPTSAGSYAPGQEKAPAAFRRHGIVESLAEIGWAVRDAGDTAGYRWHPDVDDPEAANLPLVTAVARETCAAVSSCLANGERVLVLGGDCTIEIGVVAAVVEHHGSTGLIYVDLDVDLNNPEHAEGPLDWMGVAHMLGIAGCRAALVNLGSRTPLLAPASVLFFGADAVTSFEAATMDMMGLEKIGLAEVAADPAAAAHRAVEWGSKFDRIAIHVDVDVLAFASFPIAENVRRRDGLSLPQLGVALAGLLAAPNWVSLTVTEANPDHAPQEDVSFKALIGMLTGALSECRSRSSASTATPLL